MQAGEGGGTQQQQEEGNGLLTSSLSRTEPTFLPAKLGPYSCHVAFRAGR